MQTDLSDMKIIGENLKILRKENGLTQKDVADRLGISFQQIQKYETGQNKLPIESLFFLKHYYDTSFDIFFHGIGHASASYKKRSEDEAQRLMNKLLAMNDQTARRKILRIVQILTA